MRRIILASALSLSALFGMAIPAQASPHVGVYTGSVPVSTWERLAACESSGRWYINTGNGYYGGVQFSASTWDAYGGEQFSNNAHQTGKFNQMTVAHRVAVSGFGSHRPQGWGAWPVCSQEAGVR